MKAIPLSKNAIFDVILLKFYAKLIQKCLIFRFYQLFIHGLSMR